MNPQRDIGPTVPAGARGDADARSAARIGALGFAAALSAGSHLWGRALGEPDPRLLVQVRSVAGHGSGASLVAGSLTGTLALDRPLTSSPAGKDPFVELLDSDGACRQSLLLGGTGARELASAAFDPAGNVILAGKLAKTLELGGRRLVTPDHTGSSGFVARLDRNGQLQWVKHLTTEASAWIDIHGAAPDARGNVIASGYVDGEKVFLDGAELAARSKFAIKPRSLGAPRLEQEPPLRPRRHAASGHRSFWQRRLRLRLREPGAHAPRQARSRGNQLFWQKLGGGDVQDLTGLAVDSAGNILLAGHGGLGSAPPEGESAFIARLDPEGRVLTVRRGKQLAYAGVAVGDHDSVIVAGSAPPSADWGGAAVRGAGPRFVARLDARLRPVWVARLEGDASPALTVGAVPGRAALVAGSFRGSLTLGGRPIRGGAGEKRLRRRARALTKTTKPSERPRSRSSAGLRS